MNEMNMNRDELIFVLRREFNQLIDEKELLERTVAKKQNEIDSIQAERNTINRKLVSANEELRAVVIKQNQVINRLFDAIESMIDKMLRQTIAQRTHGQRNQDIRRWCSELLQILSIADDDNSMDDIPF
jgi:sugar-specific transcriptional regulator TrmB